MEQPDGAAAPHRRLGAAIEAMKGSIEALAAEIKALQDGIRALDKDVSQATEQRKQEHEEHEALTAADSTAKEAPGWAKIRLSELYAPSLQRPRRGTS